MPAYTYTARFFRDKQDFVTLHVVDTADEARAVAPGFTDEMRACCYYDHDAKTPKKADIVFLSEHLNHAIIVHECVHAAWNWVLAVEMPNAPAVTTDDQMHAHFEEALAQVTEQLCLDAFDELLVPQQPCPTGCPPPPQ